MLTFGDFPHVSCREPLQDRQDLSDAESYPIGIVLSFRDEHVTVDVHILRRGLVQFQAESCANGSGHHVQFRPSKTERNLV